MRALFALILLAAALVALYCMHLTVEVGIGALVGLCALVAVVDRWVMG